MPNDQLSIRLNKVQRAKLDMLKQILELEDYSETIQLLVDECDISDIKAAIEKLGDSVLQAESSLERAEASVKQTEAYLSELQQRRAS